MKEKIKVKDLAKNAKYPEYKNLCIDDWDTCVSIQDKEKDFDASKGFIDHEIVIKRLSDDKFFKFSYTEFGTNGNDMLEQIAIEVEEKTKIKTIYYYE